MLLIDVKKRTSKSEISQMGEKKIFAFWTIAFLRVDPPIIVKYSNWLKSSKLNKKSLAWHCTINEYGQFHAWKMGNFTNLANSF